MCIVTDAALDQVTHVSGGATALLDRVNIIGESISHNWQAITEN